MSLACSIPCGNGTATATSSTSGFRRETALRARRSLERGRRTQKLVQPLDADASVVELEELLLRGKWKREKLGEARADPRGGIEAVRRLEEA